MSAPRQRKVTSWDHGSPANDAQATVVHAGRRVPVVVMGTMSGMQRPGVAGEDVLCRSVPGDGYYLVRQTCRDTPHPRWGRVRLPVRLRRRWVRVHRLSVRAGILQALAWGQSRTMRNDLAALLKV